METPEIDDIPFEFITYAGDGVKDILYKLVCKITKADFQKGLIITLPKKLLQFTHSD